MNEFSKELLLKIYDTAERAVSLYVRGIFTVEDFSQLIAQELYTEQDRRTQKKEQNSEEKEMQASTYTLWRIAQRISSRMLHDAWCSGDDPLYEKAYINLVRYFTHFLRFVPIANLLRTYDGASEDAVLQTLEELLKLRSGEKKLHDPAAFLRWSQVILKRKALAILIKRKGEEHNISLDTESGSGSEELIDPSNRDLIDLHDLDLIRDNLLYIFSNKQRSQYQKVMLYYLDGLSSGEIAQRMGITVNNVYKLRHRALKILRQEVANGRALETLMFLLG